MRYLALILLAGVVSACKTGYAKTAELHHAESVRCGQNEAAIVQDCGDEHVPNSECRDRILRERARCAMVLEDICKNGRGCP